MSKRVLITGSEGFTGKYVSAEFTQAGWEVWGAGVQAKPEDPQYLQIDLLKPDSLKPIAHEIVPDVVIHLAALAFVAEEDPGLFYQVNVIGTRNLLEALCHQSHAPECIILASSANVYGNSESEVLSESCPTRPANDYAVSKLAMEYLARTYSNRLPIAITRPFNYTGVGQSGRFLIPKIVGHFKRMAPVIELGNLDVAREFSDVRDVALIYRLLAESRPIGETINLCSGQPLSLQECLSLAGEISGHTLGVEVNPAFVRNNEIARLSGDRTKLESLIAAPAPRSFGETLEWMLQYPL
jgi:nucleoside-diphosphate-sugar epimerase